MSILERKRPKLADIRPALAKVERRLFMRQALSFGALSMLTGCDIGMNDDVEKFLWKIAKFNDKVQAALFDPNALAPVYPESATPFTTKMIRRRSTGPITSSRFPAWSRTRLRGIWRGCAPCRRPAR
jgi:hypothetical protein